MFKWLFGRSEPKQPAPKHKAPELTPAQNWENAFQSWFHFSSSRLVDSRFKKEALLRLAILAKDVEAKAQQWHRDTGGSSPPSGRHFRVSHEVQYNESFSCYQKAFLNVEHFDPVFAKEIPHWTELPKFVEDWLAGNPLVVVTVKTEPTPEEPRRLALASA